MPVGIFKIYTRKKAIFLKKKHVPNCSVANLQHNKQVLCYCNTVFAPADVICAETLTVASVCYANNFTRYIAGRIIKCACV